MKKIFSLALLALLFTCQAHAQDEPHSGDYAAKFTYVNGWVSGHDHGLRIDPSIAATAGHQLSIKFWAKGSLLSRVTVAAFSTADETTSWIGDTELLASPLTLTDTWTEYTYSYNMPPGAFYIVLNFRPEAGNHHIVLDDVSIIDMDDSNNDLMASNNPGFEDWTDSNQDPALWSHYGVGGADVTLERIESSDVENWVYY